MLPTAHLIQDHTPQSLTGVDFFLGGLLPELAETGTPHASADAPPPPPPSRAPSAGSWIKGFRRSASAAQWLGARWFLGMWKNAKPWFTTSGFRTRGTGPPHLQKETGECEIETRNRNARRRSSEESQGLGSGTTSVGSVVGSE